MITLLLALLGCGPQVDCSVVGADLVESDAGTLSCEEGEQVVDYIELVAGRPVPKTDATKVLKAIATRFREDPAGTRTWLAEIAGAGAELSRRVGLDGAEARSQRVWSVNAGKDLIGPDDGDLWNVQTRAVSVWTKDDTEQLAMTESDVEGWIRYASLCREAQGGKVLLISVADRVTVYHDVIERFDTGDRATKIALGAMGPFWAQVRDAWKAASYDEQMEWVGAAPLPPPMTATSLGYAEAVFNGNLPQHAQTLHDVLGPFPVGREGRFTPVVH